MEHGAIIPNDLNTNTMNRNPEMMELVEDIYDKINAPKTVSLTQDLERNSYTFKQGLKEELILNQNVIDNTSMTDGESTVIVPFRVPDVARPGIPNSVVPYFMVMDSTNGMLSYVYESGATTAAGVRLENVVMPQGDREYSEESVRAVNIGGYMTVTDESLEDAVFMVSEINNGLKRDIELLLSDQIINGSGTLPQMKGLLSIATAFSAGNFATAVSEPSYWDVLKVAANQVLTANFNPTLAICHPEDYTRLQLGFNDMTSADFQVFPTTQMTVDNYLILDTQLVRLYLTGQQIKFAKQNENNIIHNRTTITGLLRAMLKASPNQYTGIVKGVFTTDLAAITST